MRKLLPLLLIIVFSTSACYHAKIVTDREPSGEVVEEEWVTGFIYGLVIPEEIDVAEECPNGVARVETKLSFLNQLATFVTGGIYSPMTVKVTCAEPMGSSGVRMIRGTDAQRVLEAAVAQSRAQQHPVYVQLSGAD